tara:strand:- start:286 stop:738 length:453 start_codon:yes stop_codon:yes gene_type:complete
MTLIKTDLWNKEQERRRKDKRSNFERYLDDLLKMIPDKYDRQEYRKESKKELKEVETLLSLIKQNSRQLDELKKGLVKKNEEDSQGMYVFQTEKQLSRGLESYKDELPTRVSILKTDFESLISEIKKEISRIEELFESDLFSKYPMEEND